MQYLFIRTCLYPNLLSETDVAPSSSALTRSARSHVETIIDHFIHIN